MCKIKRLFLFWLFAFVFTLNLPLSALATPVYYSVTGFGDGYLAHQAGHPLLITGYMMINDQSYDAGNPIWGYNIESFSLNIQGGYSFYGTGAMNVYGAGYNENSWHLNGNGDWTFWAGDNMNAFFHDDLSLYANSDDFSALAPVIFMSHMSPTDALPGGNIYFSPNTYTSGLWLTRVSAAPVPEPATIILLGTGLIGLAGVSRKKRKKGCHA